METLHEKVIPRDGSNEVEDECCGQVVVCDHCSFKYNVAVVVEAGDKIQEKVHAEYNRARDIIAPRKARLKCDGERNNPCLRQYENS